MRVLDIVIYLWILQLSLFIIGAMYGTINISQPQPLITAQDVENLVVYRPGTTDSPISVAARLLVVLLTPVLTLIIGYKYLGLSMGSLLIFTITVGIGLYFFGKTLYYMVSLGTMIDSLVQGMTNGEASLDTSMVWGLNALGWIMSFLAVVDWWRGTSMRELT